MHPSSLPRIFCDFNGLIAEDVYSLDSLGSRSDISAVSLALHEGLLITVYAADEDADGEPVWLVADATVVSLSSSQFGAHVNPGTWRQRSIVRSTAMGVLARSMSYSQIAAQVNRVLYEQWDPALLFGHGPHSAVASARTSSLGAARRL